MFFELIPAYGRDYKNKAEVIAAFETGKDFEGDFNLNFRLCNKADFKPGDTVNLRYKSQRSVAVYKVPAKSATA